jgi:hypothetical protein
MTLRQSMGVILPDEEQFDYLQGTVELARQRQRREDERRALGCSPIMLETDGEETLPTTEQELALTFFLEHEATVCRNVLDAVLRHYRQRRDDEPQWFEDDKPVETIDDLGQQLEFNGLNVRREAADGLSLLGFSFSADWEPEHGLGVCVHGDTVLDVGDWEVCQNGPYFDFSPWIASAATPKEREHLARIASQIETGREDDAGPLAASYVEMLRAISTGDVEALQRLRDGGLEVDQLPPGLPHPLFAAIENQNPALVRQLLASGADAAAKFDYYGKRQSPLEFAQEQLANYRHARAMQDRELAGLAEMAGAPASASSAGTLLGGIQAVRAMAVKLLGRMEGGPLPPVELPAEAVAAQRQRSELLVADSRRAQERLEEIVRLLTSP